MQTSHWCRLLIWRVARSTSRKKLTVVISWPHCIASLIFSTGPRPFTITLPYATNCARKWNSFSCVFPVMPTRFWLIHWAWCIVRWRPPHSSKSPLTGPSLIPAQLPWASIKPATFFTPQSIKHVPMWNAFCTCTPLQVLPCLPWNADCCPSTRVSA